MNKTQACKLALSEVGDIYKFGDNYRFNYYDSHCKAYRESLLCDYHSAIMKRRAHLIESANSYLNPIKSDEHFHLPEDYIGGRWQSYVG